MVTVGHVIPTMETALASEFTFQYVMVDEGVTISGIKLFAGFANTHKIHPIRLVRMCVCINRVFHCVGILYLYSQVFYFIYIVYGGYFIVFLLYL